MKIETSLSRLAAHVAQRATLHDTPFSETLDAFGKLITYYSALKKNKATTEETSSEPDFTAFQAAIENHNGQPKVRGGRGTGDRE